MIANALEVLKSESQVGEPRPESITLRDQLGFFLKRRLYRLFWWQIRQFNTLVDLMSPWIAAEERTIGEMVGNFENFEKTHSADISRLLERISQITYELQSESSQRERLAVRVAQLTKKIETDVPQQFADLAEAVDAKIQTEFPRQISGLAERIGVETQQHLSALTQRFETETKHLATRLSSLGLSTSQTKESLSIQDRRLHFFIEEARKRLPEPLPRENLARIVDHQDQHQYDSLYAAFEDVFRGSRQDIKARQAVYLPILKEHSIGSPIMPLLDLGCGRGEWLELLGEHGLQARGIDSNEAMVERCKSFDLQVELADSIAILESLPDATLGAVTAFHMVEHMPFEVVLKLVDEVLRVLKPGGLIILETPNPANLWVGGYTFHLDPTHLKPLPSPMLRFFVEGRGFCDVHVQELHPYPETLQFPDDNGGIASRFNNYLYGPQDYAVVARKP